MRLNQYEWDPVKDKLGEGTFAEVFKAKDIHANRHVALKIYKTAVKGSATGSTGQSKYSLEQEFQNIQAVSHTNIISYYGLNYIKHIDAMGRETSHPVIIMEYANQGTLIEFLRTKPSKATLDKLVNDIIKGVGHLHEEGIIHRDLKPGNILVNKNKRGVYSAKITDFGISKDTLSSDDITKSHTELIGTPHYMAPEQIYQKKFGLDGRISSRTDLWAIGVIIYKIFTGNLPFANGVQDIELVHEAITQGELDLSGVPEKYHGLLKKCFQKKASDRVSDANQMMNLIDTEQTVVSVLKEKSDLDKTVVFSNDKDEDKESLQTVYTKQTNTVKDFGSVFVAPSKIEKIVLAVFGIVNILWFGYYWFSEDSTPYVYLLYPLIVILFCFFYLKPIDKFLVPKFLVYGLLMYCNIIFLALIGFSIFEGTLESKSIIKMVLALIFSVGLSLWLILKLIRKISKQSLSDYGMAGYLLSASFLVYLTSFFLNIYKNVIGASTFLLIDDNLTVLTLLPNIFLMSALFFFLFKEYKEKNWLLWVMFVVSIFIASIWWLVLDYDNGYKISLVDSYIQELKAGYYLWFFSIFTGFSIILYNAFKTSKVKKFYWPILGALVLTLGITFYGKWSNSKNAYNFNRGVENVDYNQFKKAFSSVKPLNVRSYDLKNFVKNILAKYNDRNSVDVKQMLELFVNSNGEVTYIEDDNLETAIRKQDPELLKILLNPTGSTRFEDVDFVHEDKSLLQLTRDLDSPELEKLLVDAGAKLTAKEIQANAIREKAALDAKKFYYFEDFTNGSEKFSEDSRANYAWTHSVNNKLRLHIKKDKRSFYKTEAFNLLDFKKAYTASVKIEKGLTSSNLAAGLVFDHNGTDYHVVVLQGNIVRLYKYEKEWKMLKEVKVFANKNSNLLKISKIGDYLTCYLNGKNIISVHKIKSFNGFKLGVTCVISKVNDFVYFDDFEVTGTKK